MAVHSAAGDSPTTLGAVAPFGALRARVPLGRVLDALGPALLAVLSGDGAGIDVLDVVIHDPAGELAAAPGDVVLGIGVRTAEALAELLAGLREREVAGVVVKMTASQVVSALPTEPGWHPVVLGLAADASWSYLASLVRSLLAAASAPGDPAADLFGLADSVSGLVDAPVTIEDLSSRVLAFSGHQVTADAGRHDTILGRQVPASYLQMLEERGVFRWLARESKPIYIDPLQDSMHGRVAVSVRAGSEALGSIWAVVDQPLDPDRERVFVEAARVVALHLLRLRAEGDLDRRLQVELVRAVLAGGHGAAEAAARLGVGSGPLCVLAVQPLIAEASQQEAACERLRQRLVVHTAALRARAAVAQVGGVVYAIVAGRDAAGGHPAPVVALTEDFAAQPGEIDAVIGIGRCVEGPADLSRSRADADGALRVLRHEATYQGSSRRVARFADVQVASFLLRLADMAAEEGDVTSGPLGALLDYDAEHRSGLVDTVAAYLEAFGDVAGAAAAIHIHPNTFRYRLRRASEISGLDLSQPDARFALMLQLRLRRTMVG